MEQKTVSGERIFDGTTGDLRQLQQNEAQLTVVGQETVYTKLIDKHRSPAVIRKITKYGFPIYVGIICDNDLENFDDVLFGFMEKNKADGWVNNIQKLRNLIGMMSEHLCEVYPKTEGVAIVAYVDKCMITSLFGDYMNHGQCKLEFFTSISIMTQI